MAKLDKYKKNLNKIQKEYNEMAREINERTFSKKVQNNQLSYYVSKEGSQLITSNKLQN